MKACLKRLLIVTCVIAWVLTAAVPAFADHLELEASVPGSVQAGEIIEVRVVVRSTDTLDRVPGAAVAAYRNASIVGVEGQVEIANATTDALGVAILRWQERGAATDTIILAYATHEDEVLESNPVTIVAVGSGPQIVRSTSGVQIPGLGAWVLIGLLVTIWGIIQFALVGPVQVARAGSGKAAGAEAEEEPG